MNLHMQHPYQPLYVGAFRCPTHERNSEWRYDDTGVSEISRKNATFCELTGINWIWNNNTSDITGLVHYRRYFRSSTESDVPLTETEIQKILVEHECIVAKRTFCTSKLDGYLCSAAEQYRTCHSSTDLIQLEGVIRRYFRSYLQAFKTCMKRDYLYPFNMIICNKDLFDRYCQWLFKVESHLEERIDPYTDRDAYQRRVFGFLAERLLNVYLEAHHIDLVEYPIFDPIHPDSQSNLPYEKSPLIRPKVDFPIPDSKPTYDGQDYSQVFDYRFYLEHNADLAKAYANNVQESLQHFIVHGIHEKRMAHPCFSIRSYIKGHPELHSKLGDEPLSYLLHYLDNPNDNAHVTGYENMLAPVEHSSATSDPHLYTCSGKRINEKKLLRHIARAEKMPVID